MHVNAKKMAFLGLLLAVAMILTLIGGYFEPSTLFFMAAAAFCSGIAVRECGRYLGAAFVIAGILLAFFLAPNKMYIITYGGMSIYIYFREFAFDTIADVKKINHRTAVFWGVRYILFNLMFIPAILILPRLFYPGDMSLILRIVIILGAQVVLYIYDRAYEYFQAVLWNRLRKCLRL